MKEKSFGKIVKRVLVVLLAVVLLFVLGTFVFHKAKRSKEVELLKEKGMYNPVSVGDYCLNAAIFGNENAEHTIVAMAGLGMGDYSVGMRQMTAPLEENYRVVFVDRAGYGLSDDTKNEMTLEYIVEDYRKALKSAGIEGPYILMPHSIGGAYATYWVSNYPEEIEAVVFVDGSQIGETAFDDEPGHTVGFKDRALAFLAKMGFSRYVLRSYAYHYPDNFSEEEQELADALSLMTFESAATVSENGMIAENAQDAFNGIVSNDVPKLYICSSWGFETAEEINEYHTWLNRQKEINHIEDGPSRTDFDDEEAQKILDSFKKAREDDLYPYTDKMGNCEVVCLAGDHMIYEQKPEECAEIISKFLDGLDG